MDASPHTPINRALATVATGAQMPAARVLCKSFLRQHPDAVAFVLLLDHVPGGVLPASEVFEPILAAQLALPAYPTFMYQYPAVAAARAVQPYLIRHLFDRGVQKLVYLDVQTWVQGPLTDMWSALDAAPLVLTPILLRSQTDDHIVGMESMAQQGVYDLGCLALRPGTDTDWFLDWWQDCVSASSINQDSGLLAHGWINLAPAYLPGTHILRVPTYGVATWNLHERMLGYKAGQYFAERGTLTTFSFAGVEPRDPDILSTATARHMLQFSATFATLCADYHAALVAEGYADMAAPSYYFEKLPNGLPVTDDIRWVVRECLRRRLPMPEVSAVQAFCKFLLTPNTAFSGSDIGPLLRAMLEARPDLRTPFATIAHDRQPFYQWLLHSGKIEHNCEALVDAYRASLYTDEPFARIRALYASRDDLRAAFPDAFSDAFSNSASSLGFRAWLRAHGTAEAALTVDEITDFCTS